MRESSSRTLLIGVRTLRVIGSSELECELAPALDSHLRVDPPEVGPHGMDAHEHLSGLALDQEGARTVEGLWHQLVFLKGDLENVDRVEQGTAAREQQAATAERRRSRPPSIEQPALYNAVNFAVGSNNDIYGAS